MLTISNPPRRTLPISIAGDPLAGNWRQWLTYGLVGGSSTIVDLGVFNGTLWAMAGGADKAGALLILLAGGLAAFASSLNSYAGHRRWTFQGAAPRKARLRAFLALNALTMLLNALLAMAFAWVLPQMLALPALYAANLSKLLATGGSGIAAVVGNKYWVFGSAEAARQQSPVALDHGRRGAESSL